MNAMNDTPVAATPAAARWEHMSESNEHFTPVYIVEAAREALGGIDLDPASNALANSRVQAPLFYSLDNPGHTKPWHGRVLMNPPGGCCDEDFHLVIKKSGARPACTVSGACGLPPGHTHTGVDSSAKMWWFKLAEEWAARRVKSAIFVGFSLEMLQTMQVKTPKGLPTPLDFPLCFPRVRVPYDKYLDGKFVKGKSPPHASFIVYLPLYDSPDLIGARHILQDGERPRIETFEKAFASVGKILI
jgi:hypothetical protein